METKWQTIETDTPCPRCGGKLHLRQWKPVFPEGVDGGWHDEGRICPRGCRYTADEVVE